MKNLIDIAESARTEFERLSRSKSLMDNKIAKDYLVTGSFALLSAIETMPQEEKLRVIAHYYLDYRGGAQ